jgi:hypothetical protein
MPLERFRVIGPLAVGLGVLVPAADASAAIKPRDGFYRGLTSQGGRGAVCPNANDPDPFGPDIPCEVTFRVKNGIVRRPTFGIDWPSCAVTFQLYNRGRVNGRGRFSLIAGDSVFKGRFVTPSRVVGTVAGEPSPASQRPGCEFSKTVGFTAKRGALPKLPRPANDSFANAQTPDGLSATGTNVRATKEPGEPNHAGNPGGHSVWYRLTSPVTGRVTVNTCGSDFDTLLAIYTGTSVGALTEVASNDDGCGPQSSATFSVTAGTTYYAAVDGSDGATGSITISAGLAP